MDPLLRRMVPYACAVLITGVAVLVRSSLTRFLGDHYPLGTFYAAVAIIGWFWGARPAILAAVLGYVIGYYLFLLPRGAQESLVLEFTVYAAICSALIALVYRVYERQRRLDQALAAHASTQHDLVESDARFKRYLAALELSELRYRSVSEAFDFGMWSADAAGRLTFVSARYLDFLGATLEKAEAQVWSAIQAPAEEIQEAAARWERCKATGEPWDWEYSLRGHDGAVRRVWSRGIALRALDGRVSSWAGFSLDVTAQYSAARARDQARQRLEVVTNAMSVGVAQCSRELEYIWANPAYARAVGASAGQVEQIQGRKIEEVLGRTLFERLEPYFLRALGGETVEYEGAWGSEVDPNRWIHATYTPIWNGSPVPIGWVAVISDLTERRALEERLRRSDRRKDEFLATLAHELRNPLAPIRYATQLMKPGTPPEMAADARRMIDRQLAHMARLLDDLLDVSRITRGTLEIQRDSVDMRLVLKHAVDAARPLAESVEQELRVELPDDPLPVRGDETRLIQIIGNLINNAIKFTAAGGKIVVSGAVDGAMIVARVRDTGRGISPELLPHVFEMFTQGEHNARQTGLGIGLALAKQMVDLHGGSIAAHSDGPGRGSEFRVLLPRAAELPAMQESLADATKVSVLGADRIRVLVVDDNVDAADSLAQFLKLAGYQTRVAYDGRTAVEIAGILEPAVVLLDLGLPYLNGHEVARRLRSLPWGRTARLIALTGWGQADDVRRSRQAGFDEHLTKPVDPEDLLQRIIALTRGEGEAKAAN
ncbi:MAG TPA: ATP-binding protein [Steroidobacteraceae bacterium]|jgi:PAS domain S-box-containing protein|nr:ATP-binding protein [Steroidobacteraceae bacterium]